MRSTAVELKRALFDKELMYIYRDYVGQGAAAGGGRGGGSGAAPATGDGPTAREAAGAASSPGAGPDESARPARDSHGSAHARREDHRRSRARPRRRAAGPDRGRLVDLAIAQDGTGPLTIEQIRQLDGGRLGVPRVVFFIDHAAPAPRSELADAHAVIREFCRACGADALRCRDGRLPPAGGRGATRGRGT